MTHDLDEALAYLLDEEGGWSDNPNDAGGKTMWGVTQVVYDRYRDLIKQTRQSVSKITKPECRALYDVLYWRACGADRLPWPISYIVFDAAVNSGTSRAVRWLQAGLGVPQDGQIGPASIAAANQAVDKRSGNVVIAILGARAKFLAQLVQRAPTQAVFLGGWWSRTLRVLGRALLSEID